MKRNNKQVNKEYENLKYILFSFTFLANSSSNLRSIHLTFEGRGGGGLQDFREGVRHACLPTEAVPCKTSTTTEITLEDMVPLNKFVVTV